MVISWLAQLDPVKESFLISIAHRNSLISNKDAPSFNGFDFVNGNDERFVDPAEFF